MEHTKTNKDTPGEELSTTNRVLTAGASTAQVRNFAPVKNICAHLNAFHAYACDPKRFVEANHYCAHLNDVRQCILYDSAEPNARILGIEYMITPRLYETLSKEERKYWHSHVFEVKSGMLVMPQSILPNAAWEAAENKEMEQIVELYGKVYHLWQVDRGDKLPIGEPQLMTSYTGDGQLDFEEVRKRDKKFGVDHEEKKKARGYIKEPQIHPDADQTWKK
ncbi:hypothetical protein VUR80DRAFT_8619 [Thermomyces stellatus]